MHSRTLTVEDDFRGGEVHCDDERHQRKTATDDTRWGVAPGLRFLSSHVALLPRLFSFFVVAVGGSPAACAIDNPLLVGSSSAQSPEVTPPPIMKWTGILFAGALALTATVTDACTTLIAGKNATKDGSVLVRVALLCCLVTELISCDSTRHAHAFV